MLNIRPSLSCKNCLGPTNPQVKVGTHIYSEKSTRADIHTYTNRFMQFTLLMAHSAQNASHTRGIHNHQMWEHAEIWKKKVEEEKRREGRWAGMDTALKFQPSPPKKRKFQSATECGDGSSSNIGFEWCEERAVVESHSQHSALETCTTTASLGTETWCCLPALVDTESREEKILHASTVDPLRQLILLLLIPFTVGGSEREICSFLFSFKEMVESLKTQDICWGLDLVFDE